jgi:hypothetical protein
MNCTLVASQSGWVGAPPLSSLEPRGEHGGDRICGLEATPEPKTILLSDCGAERSDGLTTFNVTVGVMPGGAIVSDAQLARAEYYRQTAEEIRRFARQSRFPEIGKELFEPAERFDRMAAFVESRQLARTPDQSGA